MEQQGDHLQKVELPLITNDLENKQEVTKTAYVQVIYSQP